MKRGIFDARYICYVFVTLKICINHAHHLFL